MFQGLCLSVSLLMTSVMKSTTLYVQFADQINSADLLHSDIYVFYWRTPNYMKFNKCKIFLSTKNFQSSVARKDSIKDLGVHFDYNLHFHNHVNNMFPHCVRFLYSSQLNPHLVIPSMCECVYILYFTLIQCFPDIFYADTPWGCRK
jgi:hypothetical protein